MQGRASLIGAALASAVVIACGSGGGSSDAGTDGSDLDDLWAFYELMQENALSFEYADGQWEWDQGDGRFYGTAFYARVGYGEDREDCRAIADAARDHNVVLLDTALVDIAFFEENFEEVVMATLGLIEYRYVTGDDSFMPQVESLIDNVNDVLAMYGDYLTPEEVDSWALQLYGPTTVTGSLALLNIQYAYYLDTSRRTERIARAEEIVDTIDATVFDGTSYMFSPAEDRDHFYPNVMMMIVLGRLHEITGDVSYLERAEGLYEAVQPLKYSDRPGYHSPYSAELMGATTDDYSTLSVHNYFSLAMIQLHILTGEQVYLDEAVEILQGFIHGYLYQPSEGILVHHWMDGAIAQPEHVEYFCSGCNLQFLYVVWFLRDHLL